MIKKLPAALILLAGVTPVALLAQESAESQEVRDLDPSSEIEYQERKEETKTLFPIPDYSGDAFNRDTITGDWGGLRTDIAKDAGIQFGLEVNQYFQGVLSGGSDEGWEYNGSADYHFRFDSNQAGLWPGGFLDVHGETYWGSNVNGSTGAILPVNTDPALALPAGNGTYLTSVVFTQFLTEKIGVMLGKLDTSIGDANSFAHGVGDRRFMNLGFSFNPTVFTTAPYSTLGAGAFWFFAPGSAFTVMVIDGDGQIDRAGFDTLFKGNTTTVASVRLRTNFFGKAGHQIFSGMYGNGSFTALAQDPRILFPAAGLPPTTKSNSWAFAYNFDQYLVADPNDPTIGWGLFGRFGIADEKTNIIRTFYSVGLGGTGLIPGRKLDRFGVGYYYMKLSDDRLGIFTNDDEQGIEVFYNMAVTPWFEMSADLQVVDGAFKDTDTAVVGGFRARIVF